MNWPTIRGVIGGAALAALLLLTLKQCQSAEIRWEHGITNCGHHWTAVYVDRTMMETAGKNAAAHNYRALGLAFGHNSDGVILFDQAAMWNLPLAHEQDHLDGMEHTADMRQTVAPSCGHNRD